VVIDAQTPLDGLRRVDVADASDGELAELMVMARRLASQAQAVELATVAELARRRYAEDESCGVGALSPREYLSDEVAEALTLTAVSADDSSASRPS
jgi:hypothetical protein